MVYTDGVLLVTGPNATAKIFASYPAPHLSVLNGFVDQVKTHDVHLTYILHIYIYDIYIIYPILYPIMFFSE